MGLAPKAGIATAPLEAVDDLAPRSRRIPACLREVDEDAPVVVAKSAVTCCCVDIEAVPVPAAPRGWLHARREAVMVDHRLQVALRGAHPIMADVVEGDPTGCSEPELVGEWEDEDTPIVQGAAVAIPEVEVAGAVGALLESQAADILSHHLADGNEVVRAIPRNAGGKVVPELAAAVEIVWDNVVHLLSRLEVAAGSTDDAVGGALAARESELLVAHQVHAGARVEA